MICQNSEQTKLSSLKIIYAKGTEAQGVLAPLSPSGLIVLPFTVLSSVCFRPLRSVARSACHFIWTEQIFFMLIFWLSKTCIKLVGPIYNSVAELRIMGCLSDSCTLVPNSKANSSPLLCHFATCVGLSFLSVLDSDPHCFFRRFPQNVAVPSLGGSRWWRCKVNKKARRRQGMLITTYVMVIINTNNTANW